jgi:hypothetical protein
MREFKSHLSLQLLQCHLTVRYSAHNRGYVGIPSGNANANDSHHCDQCSDGVMAAPGSPKPLVWVQILVAAFYYLPLQTVEIANLVP